MFRQYRVFHRLFRLYNHHIPKTVNYTKLKEIVRLNLLIGTQICCTYTSMITEEPENVVNLEDDITKALQEGDAAVIKLMHQLKDFVIVVSEEYKKCLLKQIEIIQNATDTGPYSDAWDELPQYRTLANELQKELNEYCTLFKTLEALARNRSTANFPGGVETDNIVMKFREIQNFIQKEVDENRRIETELLKIMAGSIVNGIVLEEAHNE